jgi:ribosomal protein S9
MPNIKKIALQKILSGTMYQIMPQTVADIVKYTKSVSGTTTETTVSAELAALAAAIAALDTPEQVNAKVAALKTEIIGELGDNESLDSAFDTLKEVSDYLAAHPNVVTGITNRVTALEANLGVASEAAVGNPGDPDYKAAVVATGLNADVEDHESRISTLESVGSTKVEASTTNGNIKINGVETQVYNEATLSAKIGNASVAAVGNPGDSDYVAPQAGTGLTGRVEDLEEATDTIEAAIGDASTAGTIIKRISDLEAGTGNVISVTASAHATSGDGLDGKVVVNGSAVTAYAGDPQTIQQDTTHRFVSDAEKTLWNNLIVYAASVPQSPSADTLYLIDLGE